jgi:hypothetical protein
LALACLIGVSIGTLRAQQPISTAPPAQESAVPKSYDATLSLVDGQWVLKLPVDPAQLLHAMAKDAATSTVSGISPCPSPAQPSKAPPWNCPSGTPPCLPSQPATPADPNAPKSPTTETPPMDLAPQFPDLASGAGIGSSASLAAPGGYVDNPIPITTFRLRYESAYDDNRPDRAVYFYGRCGGPGPALEETRVDYQDISAYFELACSPAFSLFVELPYRFLNPEVNRDTCGFADMNFGFKYAFVNNPDRYVTLQMRTYCPTGDSAEGLGTNHFSIEPGLLVYQKLSERWTAQGEFLDWSPIGGTDFAGGIVQYGAGVSYLAYDSGKVRVSPVLEMMGWTVLGGKESAVPSPAVSAVQSAAGDTIVNAKFGFRVGLGNLDGYSSHSDLYVGYGRALTGDVWYKDMFRVEYRLFW